VISEPEQVKPKIDATRFDLIPLHPVSPAAPAAVKIDRRTGETWGLFHEESGAVSWRPIDVVAPS